MTADRERLAEINYKYLYGGVGCRAKVNEDDIAWLIRELEASWEETARWREFANRATAQSDKALDELAAAHQKDIGHD